MNRILSGLALAAALAPGVSSAARDNNVELSFLDNGGLIYKVNPPAFTLNAPYGSFQDGGYTIPRDNRLRGGCFITTPWLPVNHEKGQALAFPHFTLEWWGNLHPVQQLDQTLLRFQIEVRRPDGTQVQIRSYLHTGLLNLQPRAQYPDGWVSYYGRMDNAANTQENNPFGSITVSPLDEVRYSVCDLYEGGKLFIHDLEVLSYPAL
jgi:hypothetical protein